MRARTADVLDAAYSSGLRYVDVARSYGLAEQFLADWLDSRPEIEDVEVASVVRPTDPLFAERVEQE